MFIMFNMHACVCTCVCAYVCVHVHVHGSALTHPPTHPQQGTPKIRNDAISLEQIEVFGLVHQWWVGGWMGGWVGYWVKTCEITKNWILFEDL